MPEQPKNLPQTLNLPRLFEFNLSSHERKLLLHLVTSQILPDAQERTSGVLDLAGPNQLAWRVGHECGESDEEDDAPRDLNAEGEAPLRSTVGGVATGKANPVGLWIIVSTCCH